MSIDKSRNKGGIRLRKGWLQPEQMPELLELLSEPITRFDCGKLCRDYHEGISYCCITSHAVPLLYKGEFLYYESQESGFWQKWQPKSKEDRELKKSADLDQLFCICSGEAECLRNLRSICCRTFPLEPYIDRRGEFVGLTFISDFTKIDASSGLPGCPLVATPEKIRQAAIDQHFRFWQRLMEILPNEYALYRDTSADLRRKMRRSKKSFEVLLPRHLKRSTEVRENLFA